MRLCCIHSQCIKKLFNRVTFQQNNLILLIQILLKCFILCILSIIDLHYYYQYYIYNKRIYYKFYNIYANEDNVKKMENLTLLLNNIIQKYVYVYIIYLFFCIYNCNYNMDTIFSKQYIYSEFI